ncbi:PREDICTED: putative fatty acyl-CoA reductase CG5065 [Ceratosolen solmsi marchali]|uniref:Fatty acyl-CoA reductase n=1 Tax=Ceratosolen solmsi marchali TaxID=326594 RepID=A0AAJ6YK83_9HYME|nr:PREDICTED: putative fatty acyl-CoA reductase CG5065 [Ceratosolen solmsi marchali]
MVEVLMESGGQDVVVAESGGSRAHTPTECPPKLPQQNEKEGQVELTRLQEFYADQSIFITGGTGFMGKLLVEKLLRRCPGIAFIYLLVRPKKGKDVHQRTEELFDDPLFAKLREELPKFRHQIVAISGDCSLPGLGISPSDREILIREVSIVFHVAATVRFDEKLKLAVAINVQSPRDVLTLCKEMPQLKSCIHVSTAYANCIQNTIEEKFYDSPIDGHKLISLVENMDEKLVDDITRPLLGRWPNTYTFTKAVAEDIVRKEGADIPVGVFRPAIVISTYQEPIRGWIDNMYGPTGVAAGAGTGLLRSIHCDGSIKANVVPGDMTVNALIASAWDVASMKKNNKNNNDIPIYNYVSKDNPITWDDLKEMSAKYGLDLPTTRAVWYYSFRNTKNKFLHLFFIYFLHLLPALLVDTATICIGKQPRMLKVYKKIHRFMEVLNYFTTKEWAFTNEHVHALVDKLDNKDRNIFYMDMRDVVWDTYFQNYMRGIRLYLIKDPIETLPQARIKWKRMYWIHQAVKVFLACAFLRLSWFVLSTLFSAVS